MSLDSSTPIQETLLIPHHTGETDPVTAFTVLHFLLGSPQAVWQIALAKQGWLLGIIFVLSAGLAREYDRSDLSAEPYHLLIPFVASLVSCLLLYGFVRLFGIWKASGRQPTFVEFLQTYWATAPLAWLYALPVERWYNAVDAVAANFWLLGIVAAWRVLLMARTVQILWGPGFWSAFALVGAFGDFVLILAMMFAPVPVLDIMAGNRLSPAERLMQNVHVQVTIAAWVSILFWLIGLAFAGSAAKWPPADTQVDTACPKLSLSAWSLGICAVVVGGLLCHQEQTKWQHATLIQRLVDDENYQDALLQLAAFSPNDFPQHWELPPNPNYAYRPESPRRLVKFLIVSLETPEVGAWVRTSLLEKVTRGFESPYIGGEMVKSLTNDEFALLVSTLEERQAHGMPFPYYLHGIDRVDPKNDPLRAELITRLKKLSQNGQQR